MKESHVLQDALRAADLITQLKRLDQLDDIWTAYLAAADELSDEDTETLIAIGDEMIGVLDQLGGNLGWLREQLTDDELATRIDVVWFALVSQYSRTEADNNTLQSVTANDAFSVLCVDGIDAVYNNLGASVEEIESKLSILRSGEFTQGDLPRIVKCGLKLVISGASVAIVVATLWPLIGPLFAGGAIPTAGLVLERVMHLD